MKISKIVGLALVMVAGSVLADDAQMPVGSAIDVVPMTDSELGAVYGEGVCFFCALNNTASVSQANVSAFSFLTDQSNRSYVSQSNN